MNRAVPERTLSQQRKAADPSASAWVMANAGSGKTHVLTQRVMRLLLSGAPPSKILCLTFTKAAAANMSERVFRTLAQWATLADADLARAIEAIGAPRPDARALAFARQLFARTIESPGGLKIQTIHAFCEAVLHRFPFEANAPAHFEVMEEETRRELLSQAKEQTLAAAPESDAISACVSDLAEEMSAQKFGELLGEALSHHADATAALVGDPSGESFARRLAAALNVDSRETPAAIDGQIVDGGLAPAAWPNAARRLAAGSTADKKLADKFCDAAAASHAEREKLYEEIFITGKGAPRGRMVTEGLRNSDPELAELLVRERDRVAALVERRRAAAVVVLSRALATLVGAILKRYEALKFRRGLLDFDDLVERTHDLLRRSDAAWVMFKMDMGLDHILVDEAQDTSGLQWGIIQALAEEFTAGEGAARAKRTIFVVGDEKQSIYSFQGAEPHLFSEMRLGFAARHRNAMRRFDEIALTMSFRSSPGVLEAVDSVFQVPATAKGLVAFAAAPEPHQSWKSDLPGLVEVWPVIAAETREQGDDWRLPLDLASERDPEVVLANRIARQIEAWIATGSSERVHDDAPRPIRCGDILILVRTRGPLFEAIIRALKERALPVAGADRLMLTEHIAVMDLMAIGRCALLPDDDLTLACVLKSPLFGLEDDDLIALAPERSGSLWSALARSCEPRHAAACAKLKELQSRAARESPFQFYAHLLGARDGRKAMLARLGPDAGDAIDEFLTLALNESREGPGSLTLFLDRLENAQVCVKRDMEAVGQSVRVMTAHAAKGLESKIVILPDTCSAPSGRHDPNLFFLADAAGILPAYSPRSAADPPAVAAARALARQRQEAEHRRLLYVAMTRAEERLYIAGVEGLRGRRAGCWYDMIMEGLRGRLVEAPAPWDARDAVYRKAHAWPPRAMASESAPHTAAPPRPNWMDRPIVLDDGETPRLRPSAALAEIAAPLARAPQSEQMAAARRGTLIHALLRFLPALPEAQRVGAAERFLAGRAADLAAHVRGDVIARALATLCDPRLSHFFGPRSRGETPIEAFVELDGGVGLRVSGVIDRLSISENEIALADFKTGGAGAARPSPAHVAQIALYQKAAEQIWPGKAVRALLVYVDKIEIFEPSEVERAAALARVR